MKPAQNNPFHPFHLFWRNTMRNTMTRLFAASAALALTAGTATADTVIYQDDFSGTSADLDGTTPDTGANNWVATEMFNADGSIVDTGNTGIQAGSATLAFTPVDGLIYTLDVSFTDVAGDGNWLAMGFAAGQSSNITFNNRFTSAETIGKAWMFSRGDTSTNGNVAWLGTAGAGTGDGVDFSTPFGGGGDVDFRIVLDTMDGAGNWTATWFAKRPTDGTYTEVRAEAALLDETIDSVGVARSNDGITGNVTSFQLTSVPEPSSLALLGLGGLAVARRRRSA